MSQISLKDILFNEETVRYLADLLGAAHPMFAKDAFVSTVMQRLSQFELKARISFIAETLIEYLPDDAVQVFGIIVRALPPELSADKTDNDFGDFILAPFGEVVVMLGCNATLVQQSLQTLYEITKRFSMEDALRYFLNEFPNETKAALDIWVYDKHYHVRRLVSEGTRPSLPWSKKIVMSFTESVRYLDMLHADPTRYVVRSVANHLNDISKKDSDFVVSKLEEYRTEGRQEDREFKWLCRHALRTLVKRGDAAALTFLGYPPDVPVKTKVLSLPKNVSRGDNLVFAYEIISGATQTLLIDYGIEFVKKRGYTKPKIFKGAVVSLCEGEVLRLEKSHYLKDTATTFTLYPGEHILFIQINGKRVAEAVFKLL